MKTSTTVAQDFRIRPAQPADAEPAAELIYLPMGRLADYLFGADERGRALCVLEALFARPRNRFSFQFADVLAVGDRVAGLVLGYPAAILSELAVPMAQHLREFVGVSGMFRLLRRSLPLLGLKETEPDEFYIYTLAVHPAYQSHGLGERLLFHAEKKARRVPLSKCSLGVTMDNDGALRFYKRMGYGIVDTIPVPKLEKRLGYPGYYRMVKQLNEERGDEQRQEADCQCR